MQVPLQRFTIVHEDGTPAFVDPVLYATALRIPLADVQSRWAKLVAGMSPGWVGVSCSSFCLLL